ncbi:unnamed protein product, partial [Adineta ricciae]
MPKTNRRTTQSRSASAHRWENARIPSPPDVPNDDYHVDVDVNVNVDNLKLNFMEKLTLLNIEDLAEMCRLKCNTKYLSVLLYMPLRYFKIKWNNIDEYLKGIGLMTAETSHNWAATFLDGDHKEFARDLRGGKHSDSLYDIYPEIEADAKAFVVEKCSQKSGEFKAMDLVQFINKQCCELNDIDEQVNGGYIRSERSCRLDLRRWRAKFEANAQRPYFEGHERNDDVKHRNEFINYFLKHKDFYHTITEGEAPAWNLPDKSPQRILI